MRYMISEAYRKYMGSISQAYRKHNDLTTTLQQGRCCTLKTLRKRTPCDDGMIIRLNTKTGIYTKEEADNEICNHLVKIKLRILTVEWFLFRNFAIPISKCYGHGLPTKQTKIRGADGI